MEFAAPLFATAFPAFCAKHGVDRSDFIACVVRFIAGKAGDHFIVTVEDQAGKRTSREYQALGSQRTKVMDQLGRLRPKKVLDSEG